MNKVILTGRLSSDVRIATTTNGHTRANFGLAVGYGDKVDFINCYAWGDTAETAQKYLFKGMKIAIVGKITTRKYTAKDGTERTSVDIEVREMEFLEKKEAEPQSAENKQKVEELRDGLNSIDDALDIPF